MTLAYYKYDGMTDKEPQEVNMKLPLLIKEELNLVIGKIPTNFKYVAIDSGGLVCAYEKEPTRTSLGKFWVNNGYHPAKPVTTLHMNIENWEKCIWRINENTED